MGARMRPRSDRVTKIAFRAQERDQYRSMQAGDALLANAISAIIEDVMFANGQTWIYEKKLTLKRHYAIMIQKSGQRSVKTGFDFFL